MKTKRDKGSKLLAVADRTGLSIAAGMGSASSHEVTLVEATLDERFIADLPERLIGDRTYDSDQFAASLADKGIEMNSPHKTKSRKAKTQDSRSLRRNRRRWLVERLFAWLQNFRRLITRHEYKMQNYRALIISVALSFTYDNIFETASSLWGRTRCKSNDFDYGHCHCWY